MKLFTSFFTVACLGLAWNSASAVPLQINIDTLGLAAGGEWELTGATQEDAYWGGIIIGSQTWDLEIGSGAYVWEISGVGALASVAWNLVLAGELVHSGTGGGLGLFTITDSYEFVAVNVPEPATLGILGFGLVALGFANRRRRRQTT